MAEQNPNPNLEEVVEPEAQYPDAYGYYIDSSFYKTNIGTLIMELLELNGLRTFMVAQPRVYEVLCREIYLTGKRDKEDSSISAKIGDTEIIITQADVSSAFDIPCKKGAVENIWNRKSSRLEAIFKTFFKKDECNYMAEQDKAIKKKGYDDFRSMLMDVVNKAIDGKQSSWDQMGTNEWKQLLSLFKNDTNWCIVLLHNFQLASEQSHLKFKKTGTKMNMFRFMSGVLIKKLSSLDPPLDEVWLSSVKLSESKSFNKSSLNLKKKGMGEEEVANNWEEWRSLVDQAKKGVKKKHIVQKGKKIADREEMSSDSHERVEVDPKGKKKRKDKKQGKGKKKKGQTIEVDSERTLSDNQDKDEEQGEDADSHGKDAETTDSLQQMAAPVSRVTRSKVLSSTELSSLPVVQKRKGSKLEPKSKKSKLSSPPHSPSQKDKSSSDYASVIDGLLNLKSNEPESVEKDQQLRGNESDLGYDEPNENLIKAIQHIVLDGNPETLAAVKLYLEEDFSESQINSALEYLRRKHGDRIFQGVESVEEDRIEGEHV